jgi:hypothetical protein
LSLLDTFGEGLYDSENKPRLTYARSFFLGYSDRDPDLEVKDLRKQVSIMFDLDKLVIDYLKQQYLFSTTEIKNNINLLKEADTRLDLLLLLSDKKRED